MSTLDVNPAAAASLADVTAPVIRPEHAEGDIARLIEQQTGTSARGSSLFAAVASMTLSLGLEVAGRTRASRFVGMWPTPLLVTGMYNKMVKTLGTR